MPETTPSPVPPANSHRDRGGLANSAFRLVIGKPLRSTEMKSEEISTFSGLPALSLDALTSVAYGPEAIMVVLATAGLGALHLVLPITIAIVVLLAILVISYRQVIEGYPEGGGCYAVSKANLGRGISLLAGASLIVDYTLTVAVSVSAGVEALVSAFPTLSSLTVPLCIAILLVVTLLNLRGLGDAARAFFLPTAVFVLGLFLVIIFGLVHPLAPHAHAQGVSLVTSHPIETISILLILKAFSSGCSALTGVEAIANGVPTFREPRVRHAKRTELLLGVILGVMLIGLAILAGHFHIGPRTNNTVLNQIMVIAIGHGVLYYIIALAVVLELALAANTSFGGLPLLAGLLAQDGYLPHFFALRSDRMVLARGIIVLAILSALLLIGVNGNTNTLIPMFAIGVFTGFTLAQTGMVIHWSRAKPSRWQVRAALNGVGAVLTALATIIFIATKFFGGAWIVVVVVPLLILLFLRIHSYYQRVQGVLGLDTKPIVGQDESLLVVIPVTNISRLTATALSTAKELAQTQIAIRVVLPDQHAVATELQQQWNDWDPGVELELINTDYQSITEPVRDFIANQLLDYDRIILLIPVLEPHKLRHRLLHNQLNLVLSSAFNFEPRVVIARVVLVVDDLAGDREQIAGAPGSAGSTEPFVHEQ
ncbi:APC family permease [Ferrimicrobium acidiphilum]|uniref:APC family permease n=1 Tax=Ferrimicrobium acidiphilum TaxID=121039 RepID=UPI0023F52BC5|nr:APC family permease [Ferrimicrobium acidiphilum]MCL5054003.1 APC family permease [Gammaproteobacteria bacterium]